MKSTRKMFKGFFTILFGLTIVAFASQVLAQGTWETKAPMPTGRWGPHAAAIGDILYVVGGTNEAEVTPVHEAYDITTGTWTTLAPLPAWDWGDAGRSGGTIGVIGGKLYLVGGWRWHPPLPTGTLQIYNPATNTWSLGATIPVPWANLSACSGGGVIDGKLYVLTACNGYNGYYKFFDVYDPSTNTWSSLPEPSTAHGDPAAGVIDGKLYVAGGYNDSGAINTIEVYDPATNSWAAETPMPTPRSNLAGGVINGKLYAVGGSNASGILATVEVYDPATNSWAAETPMPTPRQILDAWVINGKLYAVGGLNASGALNTLEVYTPEIMDTTPPVIIPTVTPAPNAAGWNNTNVTVSWDVSDPESGIVSSSGCATTILTTETAGTTLTCSATNGAAFSSSASVTVKIDKTPPYISVATHTPAANSAGWNNTDVTLSYACSDALSGVFTCPSTQTITAEGIQTVTVATTDVAGNTAIYTQQVKIDKTPPTVVCSASPNSLWPPNHKMMPVTATVTVTDSLSGSAGFTLASATSNEPDEGLGDGDFPNDIQGWTIGTADTSGLLRAERSGLGTGRIYTLIYTGMDVAGNSASCRATVTVPHDQGK